MPDDKEIINSIRPTKRRQTEREANSRDEAALERIEQRQPQGPASATETKARSQGRSRGGTQPNLLRLGMKYRLQGRCARVHRRR